MWNLFNFCNAIAYNFYRMMLFIFFRTEPREFYHITETECLQQWIAVLLIKLQVFHLYSKVVCCLRKRMNVFSFMQVGPENMNELRIINFRIAIVLLLKSIQFFHRHLIGTRICFKNRLYFFLSFWKKQKKENYYDSNKYQVPIPFRFN